MTSDPPGREEAQRAEEERARAAALLDVEVFARRTPGQDRVHVACVRLPGQPPAHGKLLWSTLARLRREPGALGEGARFADLGACADDPARYRDAGETFIRWLGRAPEGHRCEP